MRASYRTATDTVRPGGPPSAGGSGAGAELGTGLTGLRFSPFCSLYGFFP